MSSGLAVYHCFARSGGTIVNRLLGASRDVVVLSEVGPAASVRDPLVQAVEWLDLVDPVEVDELRDRDFGELIGELARRAASRGQHLVVRDFVTPNFLPRAFGDVLPSGVLELVRALEAAGCELARVVVARRSASTYTSIVRSFPHLSSLTVDEFAVAYHAFAAAVTGVPVIRYEDLTADPPGGLQALSEALGCPFDPDALTGFASFRNCTGDLQLEKLSRGAPLTRVTPLADRTSDPLFIAAAEHPLCRAADDRFGYSPVGETAPQERAVTALEAELGRARRHVIDAVRAQGLADVEAAQSRAEVNAARRRADVAEEEMQRLASDLAASMRRAEELDEGARALQTEVKRLQYAWDKASGELARAEGVAADRQRQIGILLAELAQRAEGATRA